MNIKKLWHSPRDKLSFVWITIGYSWYASKTANKKYFFIT